MVDRKCGRKLGMGMTEYKLRERYLESHIITDTSPVELFLPRDALVHSAVMLQ